MEEKDIFSTNYTTPQKSSSDLGVGNIFGNSPTKQFAEDLPFVSDMPRTSNVDVAQAQKYIGTNIFDSPDIEERMAKGQSWGSKFGGFIAQSLAEIGGGTLQGFGSIYEIIDNAVTEASNGDADFNNILIQLGSNIQKETKEAFPIYRKDRDMAIDLNDAGWWFENATSLASTLSLLIPAVATVRGVSYVSKLAGIADKVGDTAKTLGKVGLSAGVMRNGENMRESLHVFESVKKDFYEELSQDDNFNEWLSTDAGKEYLNEIGDREVTAEDASTWAASKAGWHTYKWNSANIVFDLIQTSVLFRGVGKTRTNPLGGKTKIREAAGLPTTTSNRAARMFNPILGTYAVQLTEGVEEAVNYIGGKEGEYYGKVLLNQRPDNKELPERLSGYVADPHLWNNFIWGVAGGVAFQGVVNYLTKDDRKAADLNKIAEINNRGKLIADAAKSKQDLFAKYNAKEISEEELLDSVNDITSTLGYHLGMVASKTGNVDILMETLDNPDFQSKIAASYTPDELKNLSITQDKLIERVKDGAAKAEENYKTFSSYLWASNASQAAKESLIATQMQTASDVTRHENAIKNLSDRYNKLIQEETETNTENFNTGLDYEAVKLAIRNLSKSSQQVTFPPRVQEKISLELEALTKEKERLETALKVGPKPNLSSVNPELIETGAALYIRKSYKSVGEKVLNDLKKKNIVNEIDKEFEDKKKQEEADDLQKLEQDLSIGLSKGNITEEKFKELDATWKGNKKAEGLINRAKKQIKEKQKADKIAAERVIPVQAEQVVNEAEQQLEVPVQPVPVQTFDTVELRKQVNQQNPGLGTSLLKEIDETNTVESLRELREKRLNTRKLKLTEDSAYIKLIDAKITQLNQANSIETTEQAIPEQVVEETANEVPVQEAINNEEIIEPKNSLKTNIDILFDLISELINIGTKEQYIKYLNTVFPDTKVDKILFNGNKGEIRFSDFYGFARSQVAFFSNSYEHAKVFGDVQPVILNITNPFSKTFVSASGTIAYDTLNDASETIAEEISENQDGIISKNIRDAGHIIDEYVVFNPNQIHKLGTKNDIEQFKNWVNNNSNKKTETNTQTELNKAKTNFSNAFSAFAKAINNTTSAGIPLSAEVITAGIQLLRAGAELGFATVKEIARYAKKEFGGNFTPDFLKGLKGAYAFANATDSLPEGIIANDDSVKELTLDNLDETVVEPVVIIEEQRQKTIEFPTTEPDQVGTANLVVWPLIAIQDYKSADKSLGYKTKPENDDEASFIFTGNIQGEVTFKIDTSNSYHKDSVEESAIEIYKDGKRTKIYLNTIPSIQKQIDVVNKIIKKFDDGKELTEQYYPEINRKIDENEWIKSSWLQELKENLNATKQIRNAVFNQPNNNYTANLTINSPGSIVNNRNDDKTSNWQKVSKTLGDDTEVFFTHPELKGGSLELIGTKGNRIAQHNSPLEFNAGRMYAGVKGLNGDIIPARLKVDTISPQDANKVYDLLLELADLVQNKSAKLDSREINEIRDKFNRILLVNKYNNDESTYFKIHGDKVELTFGDKNQHKAYINFRFPVKDKVTGVIKDWTNITTNGKPDILARFILEGKGTKEAYLFNKQKSIDTSTGNYIDFEKWIKAAITKKLYNIDKKAMLADSDYRTEVLQNRLLTDVGGVYNSKGELLGRTVLKQEGRKENAIFSISDFKEASNVN
jgi:3D (Asp-Asp-Asp) domain-containing protein